MEEGSLEFTYEEGSALEINRPVENNETFEDLREEETEETEPPDISEDVEEDAELSAEDMTTARINKPQTAKIDSEIHVITEEDDGIEALIDDTLEDTEINHFIEDLLSRDDIEDEEEKQEENRRSAPEPENERTSPANESLVPAAQETIDLNNEEHIELLQELQDENEKLIELNVQLQTKIAEYLSEKTEGKHHKLEHDISEQEQYQKCMDLIEDLKVQHQRDSELHRQQSEELQQQNQEKLTQIQHELRAFAALKYETVMTALTGKEGKQAALAKVEKLQADELKQEDKLTRVRLNNIKLKITICQYEAALKSRRKLADGLLLMDFEQLETDNQTLKEKLKERSEELLRLKRVSCAVQGISHVKEKLHFIKIENKDKRTELGEADASVALKREALIHTRLARDGLRADNLKLQQRCGLLGNTILLQDLEDKVDTTEHLQQRLEMLKRRHAELILKCAGVKQKIEQSKPQ